jgi:hypothetical protein
MRILLLALLPWTLPALAPAADPVVSNVTVAQRTDGSGLVDVFYDLADADGDTCRISLNASRDGGATWRLPVHTVSGDVGGGVAPGAGRQIVWDFLHDDGGFTGANFQVQVIASDQDIDWRSHSPRNYAAHNWGPHRWHEIEHPERVARADLLTITTRVFWDNGPNEALGIVDVIKSHNPECKVIGYVPAQGIQLFYADYPPGSFARQLYDATLPYWSYTTTGDTLMSWPQTVELNVLDEDCRAAIVDTYVNYDGQTATHFDGIFWDYFPDQVWIPDFVGCEGDADLDGDGIPQQNDADEQAAYDLAQEDLVNRMRNAMGSDFIMVFNGVRAQRDSLFAALADGINYELFPTLRFPEPKMASALDTDLYYSLWHTSTWPRTEAGGPYVLLENIQRYYYHDDNWWPQVLDSGDYFRVIGLLIDGVWPVWNAIGEHWWDWPENPVNLGDPLGPTVIDGDLFTRQFEYGEVRMEMGDGTWPDPFGYEIYVNGNLVEMLDVPYHYP